jgi:hypothetical protein
MPFTVRFDFINPAQGAASSVITDATPGNDGVMSAAQAAQLAGLTSSPPVWAYRHIAGAGTYNVQLTDSILGINTTTGAVTVNLPANAPAGKVYIIMDEGGAFAANNVTVRIGGVFSATLNINNFGVMFYSNGAGAYFGFANNA